MKKKEVEKINQIKSMGQKQHNRDSEKLNTVSHTSILTTAASPVDLAPCPHPMNMSNLRRVPSDPTEDLPRRSRARPLPTPDNADPNSWQHVILYNMAGDIELHVGINQHERLCRCLGQNISLRTIRLEDCNIGGLFIYFVLVLSCCYCID